MDINFFFPDKVILLTHDGKRVEGLRAQVKNGRILIHGDGAPIRRGDSIVRTLRNGLEEAYQVVDAQYHGAHGTNLPAVTELKVSKMH